MEICEPVFKYFLRLVEIDLSLLLYIFVCLVRYCLDFDGLFGDEFMLVKAPNFYLSQQDIHVFA